MADGQSNEGRGSARNSADDDEEEDPVEAMIKRSGCIELHHKVQVRKCC